MDDTKNLEQNPDESATDLKADRKNEFTGSSLEHLQDIGRQEEDEEDGFLLKLEKPFLYEGRTYLEIDFSGLESLNTRDYAKLLKEHERLHGYGTGAMPEYEVDFAVAACEKVTGLPRDFFLALPANEGAKIRRSVMRFFLM